MFKKILVAIDLVHLEKCHDMIDRAEVLAEENDGQITLLNVIMDIPPYVALEMPPDTQKRLLADAKTKVVKLARDHALPSLCRAEIRVGDPANRILEMAQSEDMDLIIVASHQPEFADYLLGSVAAKVVRHAPCSVMVLR